MGFSVLLVSVDIVIGKYNYDTRTHFPVHILRVFL